jgi:hypothetical protein
MQTDRPQCGKIKDRDYFTLYFPCNNISFKKGRRTCVYNKAILKRPTFYPALPVQSVGFEIVVRDVLYIIHRTCKYAYARQAVIL